MEIKPSSNEKEQEEKQTGRTLHGQSLLQVALPLGGIGAGCICLNGYGGLQDFSIHNAPATSAGADRHQPQESGYALLHLPGEGLTRLVEGPFPREKIYNLGLRSQGYNGGGFEGLPRFRNCTFRGAYPFGMVQLADPGLPLEVSITGFNPFIPLDDHNSSIPCALLEYTLHNTSGRRVPYQFSYHLSHLAQRGAEASARSEPIPGLGVSFWNDLPPESPYSGSAALGILAGQPIIKARWFRGGWFDAGSALWREVSTGSFRPTGGLPAGNKAARHGGSVLVEGELQPGERVTYPVVITWYFPNIPDPLPENTSSCCSDGSCNCTPRWRPYYAAHWQNAPDVLAYIRNHYTSLRDRTQQFHDALFSSTLQDSVLDAVTANLGILKSPTVLRYENGDVWAWEGCFCDKGCCSGSCTHVWNYAQAMAHLFPALERTLRQRELEESMNQQGHINFRAAVPGKPTTHGFHAAADGQLGGVMKVYREWQISGDRDWLARMLPLARRSMDFCIRQWDPRHTGLLEEPHHNTYDIEFWGPDGMCSSFYLGALTAMAALLRDGGQPEEARFYEALAQKGARAMDTRLFNGEYYQQDVVWEGLNDTSFTDMLAELTGELEEEERLLKEEGPKYQYGRGCISDGVFGAWLAQLCCLHSPQNRENIRQHLQSVYRYNFKPSLWEHANSQRPGYALGDESGLLLCTWPRGGKPTLPFVYSDEVWTGIEYQVASHLIAAGFVPEGLTLVEGVRSRYDGRTRNPWNEYECGNYYARALASYALLIAASGFAYSAAAHTLTIGPVIKPEPFCCFFSTASGWGTFTLHPDRLEICLEEGRLQIDTLEVKRGEQTQTLHPNICAMAGMPAVIPLEG